MRLINGRGKRKGKMTNGAGHFKKYLLSRKAFSFVESHLLSAKEKAGE